MSQFKKYHSLEKPRASCNIHSFLEQTISCEKAHFIIKSYGIEAVDAGQPVDKERIFSVSVCSEVLTFHAYNAVS